MKDKNTDIRWIQRFNNYKKALASLQEAADLAAQRELSKLEKQGVIQAFEFTHELAWKTLKDFLEYRGQQGIYGSRATHPAVRRPNLRITKSSTYDSVIQEMRHAWLLSWISFKRAMFG